MIATAAPAFEGYDVVDTHPPTCTPIRMGRTCGDDDCPTCHPKCLVIYRQALPSFMRLSDDLTEEDEAFIDRHYAHEDVPRRRGRR